MNNKLAALQGIVEVGDSKPTDQSYGVFKDLSDRLDKQFGQLDSLFSIDLATFNKLLQRKKREPVKDSLPPVESDGKSSDYGISRSTVTSTTPRGSSTATKRSSGFSMPALNRSAGRYGRSWKASVISAISWYAASTTSAIA